MVSFINCTFENNKASEGGALYFGTINGDILIINCTFKDNSATGNGGAISFQNGKLGTYVFIINSTFDKNNAGVYGGRIISYRSVYTTFENCNIARGYAASEGGFMRFSGDVAVRNSNFFNNTGKHDAGNYVLDVNYEWYNNYVPADSSKAIQIVKVTDPHVNLVGEDIVDYYNHTIYKVRLLDANMHLL